MIGKASRPEAALEAAGAGPRDRRSARLAWLTGAERELYRWILRTFAQGRRPSVEELCDTASRLELEIEPAMARLAEHDLAHQDSRTGEILVAYPFSGRPTAHSVRLGGGPHAHAMCAVDALGMPFVLGLEAEIVSCDPLTGDEIRVRVEPGEGVWSQPQGAVVFAGATGRSGPSVATCCSFINFFASAENAERYRREHPALRGGVLELAAAAEAGRLLFGDLLDASGPAAS